MDSDLSVVESLTLCNFCKQKFNSTDLCPKILQCKHYFCLKCIETTMIKGQELSCVHCWKRQELQQGGASSLPTHNPVIALANHLTALHLSDKETKKDAPACTLHGQSWTLWCHNCNVPMCRMCYLLIEHSDHHVTSHTDARDVLVSGTQAELAASVKLKHDIQRLSAQQREFQLRILEACVTLKTFVESDLTMSASAMDGITDSRDSLLRMRSDLLALASPAEARTSFVNAVAEKQRLEARYQELAQQCKIEDAIATSGCVLDFATLAAIQTGDWSGRGPMSPSIGGTNLPNPAPILLLANYCLYQLYSLYVLSKPSSPITSLRMANHSHPRYYFNVELNQLFLGKFVIETRPDMAPKMSRNFDGLCLGVKGLSYKNCSVFQCWDGESIITGDYESNNGRGGRSIFEEGYFMPDETKMAPVRGAVGMRRTQKRHDNFGLVGSQFRIILQDMRGFSAIFGHVVEGIEVVEKIASYGDHTGKPTRSIIISSCGKL